MKYYIGLGGIGCKALHTFSENEHDMEDKEFFYVDSCDFAFCVQNAYEHQITIPGISDGTWMLRNIGRNSIKYEILSGKMAPYFSKLQEADNVELVFVITSFGGFGSAAIFPLMDYLQAITWRELKSCKIIAFNENAFKQLAYSERIMQRFETNTLEFVNDLLIHEQPLDSFFMSRYKVFNPGCTSYLIDTTNIATDDVWKYIDADQEELLLLDCKGKYHVSPRVARRPVFISYSSKDQKIADMIVEELVATDIEPWIASKDITEGSSYPKQIVQGIREANIFLVLISKNSVNSEHVRSEIDRAFDRLKDGMVIVPFLLDNTELDDELLYYLSRREMISGKMPPLMERIRFLVDRIRHLLWDAE